MTDRVEFYVPNQPFDGGAYHYVESGLPNIWLRNGFSVEEDADYGRLVTFHNLHHLHDAIGLHIISVDRPLDPKEFRFLRKRMAKTQRALADDFGVSDQTIANYEKGETEIPKLTDRAIRRDFLFYILPDDVKTAVVREMLKVEARSKSPARRKSVRREPIISDWLESDIASAAFCA